MSVQSDEDEERPWEQHGAVRRDCEPHRGELIGFVGGVSLMLGVLACCGGATSLIALPLGIAAWVMARRDLAKIRAGLMDSRGKEVTRQGGREGMGGVIFSLLFLVENGLGLLLLYKFWRSVCF